MQTEQDHTGQFQTLPYNACSTQSFKYIPCLTGGATTYSKKLFREVSHVLFPCTHV